MLKGTLDRVRFRGAALQGNALGDPVERELLVYLPPSYAAGTHRYPLVMVLTGYAATNVSLLNFKPWEPNLLERYERLLAQGAQEAILVMPDCFTRWGGSQYIDSSATGHYQRYLAEDVLATVEARYRTLGKREGRAVIGSPRAALAPCAWAWTGPTSSPWSVATLATVPSSCASAHALSKWRRCMSA
jgi:enterochelin esterase-like enzyme